MRGAGRALYRSKVTINRAAAAALACLGVGLLTMGIVGLIIAAPPLAISGFLFGLFILGVIPLFGVVRMLVTEREFQMQIGLGGPRVAIDQIVECVALKAGERGVRGAKAYPLKDGDDALELHLIGGRVLRITTTPQRVEALGTAIEQARSLGAREDVGVSVEVSEKPQAQRVR